MHVHKPLTAALSGPLRATWLAHAPNRAHAQHVARLVTAPAAAADATNTGSDADQFSQSFQRLLQTMEASGVVPAAATYEGSGDDEAVRGVAADGAHVAGVGYRALQHVLLVDYVSCT